MRPIVLITLALTFLGCLERTEHIAIHPNGAVDVVYIISGDAEDIDGGAATLPGKSMFRIKRYSQAKPNSDDHEEVLEARARFASVAKMPRTFAAAGSPHRAQALQFPTRLKVERSGRRTTYLFVREYAPRSWADYAYMRRRAFTKEIQEKMKGVDWLKLPWNERRVIIQAYLDFERDRNEAYARSALREVSDDGDARTRAQLAVRPALAAYFAKHLTPRAMMNLIELPQKQIGKRAGDLQSAMDRVVVAAVAKALSLNGEARSRFARRLGTARRAYEVSDDLGDESFAVRLSLPGKLIKHNGTSVSDSVVTWEFDGKDLRDRRHVLMAMSVVEK